MADTIRDEAALQALFADNTTRSISPQKIRDFLVSVPSLASTANLALTGGTMTGSVIFASANLIRWNSDVSIGRNSATAIEINNGTAGTYQDLKLRQTTHAYLSPGTQTAQIYFEPSTGNGLGLNAALNGSAIIVTSNTGGTDMAIRTAGIDVSSQGAFNWTNTTSNPLTTIDLRLSRRASLVLGIHGNYNSTAGAALEFMEMTAPAAPATNAVRIFAEDNGSGKTRLMARFATGAVQQLAIEP